VMCFCCKKTVGGWFGLLSALFLAVIRAWSLACRVLLPRLLLHVLQAGTRLSRSCEPPFVTATRWSASVAGFPHQVQGGFPASTRVRFFL